MLWSDPGRPASWSDYGKRVGSGWRSAPTPDRSGRRFAWIVGVVLLMLLVLVLFSAW
jgi:hypothetical protein